MDVILHMGAHRSASSSFQTYLRDHKDALAVQNIGFWGPLRIRKGLFNGIIATPYQGRGAQDFARAQGRIALQLDHTRNLGLSQVIVSEENMLGLMRQNISSQLLYPNAGDRTAQFVRAFQGTVKMIVINMRCLSSYWSSALSFCLPRGVMVPSQRGVDAMACQSRNWREVITDVAEAAQGIPVFVSTYEQFGARPNALLGYLIGAQSPLPAKTVWRNQRPSAQELLRLPLGDQELARLEARIDGNRWEPFSTAQRAALQERYADDLFWLQSGADGLATYLEDPKPQETGYPAQMGFVNKGQSYDTRQRLARPG